jgi:putative endonuclease
MSNRSKTLYIGITNDLIRRVSEHKQKLIKGFSKKYDTTQLVYYETTNDVNSAIAREKQLKGWLRDRKIELIETMNSSWQDLSGTF